MIWMEEMGFANFTINLSDAVTLSNKDIIHVPYKIVNTKVLNA
jgi:hypothetical protein